MRTKYFFVTYGSVNDIVFHGLYIYRFCNYEKGTDVTLHTVFNGRRYGGSVYMGHTIFG